MKKSKPKGKKKGGKRDQGELAAGDIDRVAGGITGDFSAQKGIKFTIKID